MGNWVTLKGRTCFHYGDDKRWLGKPSRKLGTMNGERKEKLETLI